MTNFENLKQLSAEDFAEWILNHREKFYCTDETYPDWPCVQNDNWGCIDCFAKWLNTEATLAETLSPRPRVIIG